MDYIEIILRGYSNENDRKYLSKYFIRESKKAEKENYDLEEFFSGLHNGIDTIKQQYKTRFYERQKELYFMLDGAENGTLKYADLDNLTIKEKHKQTIEYCNNELSQISFENFPLNLLQFTKDSFRGHLRFSEVELIESEIKEAKGKSNKPQQKPTENVNKFLDRLEKSFIKVKFKNLKSDFRNIEEVYNNNLNIWYYFNSDTVTKKDGNTVINSGIDTINNVVLLNPENYIFCKTKDGFELSEVDFVDSELNALKKLDNENFTIPEKKQFNAYLEFLNNKLNIDTNEKFEIQQKNIHPFPLVFVNYKVYECFIDYTKKHIIDFYSDYSYLKKRLEKLKLIHYHTDNDFVTFLLNDLKFINQKDFENYRIKYESKLKSLSKSHSEQRENNFNNVFGSLL